MRISMKEVWRNLDGPPKNNKQARHISLHTLTGPGYPGYCTNFKIQTEMSIFRRIIKSSVLLHSTLI